MLLSRIINFLAQLSCIYKILFEDNNEDNGDIDYLVMS